MIKNTGYKNLSFFHNLTHSFNPLIEAIFDRICRHAKALLNPWLISQRIMSPIVLFIISLNLCLSFACLWVAWKLMQWQKALTQINQSLTIAEQVLRTSPQFSTDPALKHLQTQAHQFTLQIQPQLLPLLKFLSAIYRIQRLWSRIRLRSSAPLSAPSSAPSPAARINPQQNARNPRRG